MQRPAAGVTATYMPNKAITLDVSDLTPTCQMVPISVVSRTYYRPSRPRQSATIAHLSASAHASSRWPEEVSDILGYTH